MSELDEVAGDDTLSRLVGELGTAASAELDLRRQLAEAHREIAARDAELRPLAEELRRTREQRDEAYAELAAMRRTRLWRAGATWWWVRDVLRGARGR
jgi:predicted  nucleic acid-binding Zn-ribbon protein